MTRPSGANPTQPALIAVDRATRSRVGKLWISDLTVACASEVEGARGMPVNMRYVNCSRWAELAAAGAPTPIALARDQRHSSKAARSSLNMRFPMSDTSRIRGRAQLSRYGVSMVTYGSSIHSWASARCLKHVKRHQNSHLTLPQPSAQSLSKLPANMKKLLASVVTLVACGLSSTATPQGSVTPNSKVKLPIEVKKLLERVALCDHLAGEYDSPGSTRTIEVSQSVELNRCDLVDQELKNVRLKYANSKAVLQELAKVESARAE